MSISDILHVFVYERSHAAGGKRYRHNVASNQGVRLVFVGMLVLSGLAACLCGGEPAHGDSRQGASDQPQIHWKQFIDECISKVENSDSAFYRRGERVTGKELARQMREYLKVVLR